MNEKVLLVDDEKSILDVLSYALKKEGFCIERAYDGREALDKVKSFQPHIIVLDLMLPVINGYDVCKQLSDNNIGVIMLTAKTDIVDKILGLELGADDYLTKPFDIRELIARVKSLSRRFKKSSIQAGGKDIIRVGELTVDSLKRIVMIGDQIIEFTLKEFEVLYLLLSNPEMVYSRDQLLNIVWDMEYFGTTRTVDTHVQRVRKKLGKEYENAIVTVHGIGYKGVIES